MSNTSNQCSVCSNIPAWVIKCLYHFTVPRQTYLVGLLPPTPSVIPVKTSLPNYIFIIPVDPTLSSLAVRRDIFFLEHNDLKAIFH